LGRIPLAAKIEFARDVILAGKAIDSGVVAATTRTREKYWDCWCRYTARIEIDPILQTTDPLIRDLAITAYAARVRKGYYGHGHTIKVQGVTDALSAISKTLELAGYTSPLYRAPNTYTLPIQRCVEGFRREDPPAVPQLALPIAVPRQMATAAYDPNNIPCARTQAIADLALIAFYYLLRVGEYTKPRMAKRNGIQIRATRTVQFTVGNIGFFKEGQILARRSPLQLLITADQCTLKITNQKNGRMGETISHETAKDEPNGPVQAVARRIHHILSNGGNEDSLLSDYITEDGSWDTITSAQMRNSVRQSVKILELHKNGIDPDLVGVHSLRAGGAMALKLQGISDTIIQKQGRWTSMTFLQYIHNQIAHLTKNLSTKMSTSLTFTNIASIEKGPNK
jgi:hypothetical protein